MAASFWGSFFVVKGSIMNILDLNQISQSFAGNDILRDITFTVSEQDKVAIVGRNGSGKSTLLKIIAQENQPQKGTLSFQKNTKIAYVGQRLNDVKHKTVLNILKNGFPSLVMMEKAIARLEKRMAAGEILSEKDYERYGNLLDDFQVSGGYEMTSKIESIANGLGIGDLLSQEWQTLSGGQRTKTKLALSLVQSSNLLILDEPTNHLDLKTTDWLIDYIRNYKGAVIVVSHDRHFIDQIVTRVIEIEDGSSSLYEGNYSFYVAEKQVRIEKAFQKYSDQQDRIKKMKQSIHQLKEWAHIYNNEKFASRARSMQKALDKLEIIQRPNLTEKNMTMNLSAADQSSKIVFEVKGVSYNLSTQPLLKNIDLTVTRGNRVAILGDNGVGKSTLLKILLGLKQPTTGVVHTGPNLSIGYFSQFEAELEPQKTVLESYIKQVPMSEADARYQLSKFLFYKEDVFKKVKSLSGGERKRLRWAQIIGQHPNVIVLDEPTNDLDIGSIEMLEDTLDDYEGTVLAVSHDRYFVNNHFDIHYVLENKQLVKTIYKL
ncbi:ribosomal protection-like ABC-F family protein [Leuconostoc pseudomesenteroides]|uniref:ABC-F family ATP-binding cassette domain-containing protein n=2 Tax=Leuconostoc pseudomesenteroides TaxID=33968 RepID=A0ABT6HDD6_LEUPS|nr:ABC-F family ATP-binding cassette domain-containing protein [Leuconostoc pseudomesenteroides]MDG9734086.1 ABC-F family ATP-binding cassette domain-containing protein [Leuconostoc pseudomesenteroides]